MEPPRNTIVPPTIEFATVPKPPNNSGWYIKASEPSQRRIHALGKAIAASTLGQRPESGLILPCMAIWRHTLALSLSFTRPVASTIAAFAVFPAIGYLTRPLGALVLGWVGDRVGRRVMLVLSITILGASSCSIGLLPTYESIGIFRAGPAGLDAPCAGFFPLGGEYLAPWRMRLKCPLTGVGAS